MVKDVMLVVGAGQISLATSLPNAVMKSASCTNASAGASGAQG